ncbi:hypothetical protein DPMN_089629 [Dreissena polymorpha]|uniref:Uncharacterized protein n=1 Tax=Dreissena polymorpha TaxID=45954 RepID=A0A9D4KXC8_DREPO|nr:hypothetical protein DPMN_089629 [Dreissena polymorpha]
MVIPSGICVHPIGSTSCSMVTSHERRKPGTTLQGGVALALHFPHFSLFGTTPYSQRNRPTECHSQSATDVPSHPRKYIDYLSDPNAPFVSKEGAFAMQRTLKPLRPSRPMHPKEVY